MCVCVCTSQNIVLEATAKSANHPPPSKQDISPTRTALFIQKKRDEEFFL